LFAAPVLPAEPWFAEPPEVAEPAPVFDDELVAPAALQAAAIAFSAVTALFRVVTTLERDCVRAAFPL
jgi:hypothetical protein